MEKAENIKHKNLQEKMHPPAQAGKWFMRIPKSNFQRKCLPNFVDSRNLIFLSSMYMFLTVEHRF